MDNQTPPKSNVTSFDEARRKQQEWQLPKSSLERINHIRIQRLENQNASLQSEVEALTATLNKLLRLMKQNKQT